jgi:hypothetical protein
VDARRYQAWSGRIGEGERGEQEEVCSSRRHDAQALRSPHRQLNECELPSQGFRDRDDGGLCAAQLCCNHLGQLLREEGPCFGIDCKFCFLALGHERI